MQVPYPALVWFGPAALVFRDAPSLHGNSGHHQLQGARGDREVFSPLSVPLQSLGNSPSSPKAGVWEQGTDKPGAAGGHWAGRPLQAMGMLRVPSSSSSSTELGCTLAGPCIASGTSFLAQSGKRLCHPPPVMAPSRLGPSWLHKTRDILLHQTPPLSTGTTVCGKPGSASVCRATAKPAAPFSANAAALRC